MVSLRFYLSVSLPHHHTLHPIAQNPALSLRIKKREMYRNEAELKRMMRLELDIDFEAK